MCTWLWAAVLRPAHLEGGRNFLLHVGPTKAHKTDAYTAAIEPYFQFLSPNRSVCLYNGGALREYNSKLSVSIVVMSMLLLLTLALELSSGI